MSWSPFSCACVHAYVVEFYSVTRQLNRLAESSSSRVDVIAVPASPPRTLGERIGEAIERAGGGGAIDFVYVSQITYTQQTLIPDIPDFVRGVRAHLGPGNGLIIIDGYHGFGAVPTDLSGVDAVYVSGVLKHVGAGANLAFAVLPPSCSDQLRPVLTGWLADLAVLSPTSDGVKLGTKVGYTPGFSLMGSTPSFHSSVLLFNQVMRLWKEHNITVDYVHTHVLALHDRFMAGLRSMEENGVQNPFINTDRLLFHEDETSVRVSRSHTLTFSQDSAEHAAKVILQHTEKKKKERKGEKNMHS